MEKSILYGYSKRGWDKGILAQAKNEPLIKMFD